MLKLICASALLVATAAVAQAPDTSNALRITAFFISLSLEATILRTGGASQDGAGQSSPLRLRPRSSLLTGARDAAHWARVRQTRTRLTREPVVG